MSRCTSVTSQPSVARASTEDQSRSAVAVCTGRVAATNMCVHLLSHVPDQLMTPVGRCCVVCTPQVQSNALAALEAIDADVCEAVLAAGCITGDRINGLCDGETGDWCVTGCGACRLAGWDAAAVSLRTAAALAEPSGCRATHCVLPLIFHLRPGLGVL
jgi:hypothetical protein